MGLHKVRKNKWWLTIARHHIYNLNWIVWANFGWLLHLNVIFIVWCRDETATPATAEVFLTRRPLIIPPKICISLTYVDKSFGPLSLSLTRRTILMIFGNINQNIIISSSLSRWWSRMVTNAREMYIMWAFSHQTDNSDKSTLSLHLKHKKPHSFGDYFFFVYVWIQFLTTMIFMNLVMEEY